MSFLKALGYLLKAGVTLIFNIVRLISMKIAFPLLRWAEKIGNAAKRAELQAAEVEKKIDEQESHLE
jgi:hypothetical protein